MLVWVCLVALLALCLFEGWLILGLIALAKQARTDIMILKRAMMDMAVGADRNFGTITNNVAGIARFITKAFGLEEQVAEQQAQADKLKN